MKKIATLLLTAVSCACLAFGFAACDGVTITVTPNTDDSSSGGGSTDGGSTSGEHTMTYNAATEATCTEDGNTAYYYCSDCGKYFSDENGATEIDLSSTVVSALGHSYEVEFDWTKTSDGYTATATQYCTRCNITIETVDAAVELTSQSAATCTENGKIVYTATATLGGETVTDTNTLTDPATGHTYSEDWSNNASYHWHQAICDHTDEVSDKATHTFVNENGSYVCSVCGYTNTNVITSASDSLAVGGNYIILSDSDASIDDMTFTATASGEYTFTLSSDCQAQIRMQDIYGTYTYLGIASASGNIYTASFELAAGESLTINYIAAGNDVTFDSEYLFCLDITYTEKEVAEIGTEGKPYAFTNPDNYGGDSTKATLAAGASYYFTVTSDSDILTKISFSNTNASSFELYKDGVKIDYGTYYFSSGTTAITFELKNISGGKIENTISCAQYEPSLSTSDNSVTVTSAMLDSTNSITYSVTFGASTTYTITLGDSTDSNVAVYYTGYYGSPASELILGNGSTATSYNLTNNSSRNDRSFYITFTYTGDTIPDNFTVNISFTKVEATEDEDDNVTYTPINLNETFSMNFSNASSYYYSYTPTDSGNLTIVLTFTNTAFYSTLAGLATVTVNGTTISSSYDNDGVYYVITGGASEYNISITMTSATLTLTGTLTSGGESTETTATALVSGDNEVFNDTLYSFTASTAGTYTFTVTNGGGYTVISENSSVSSTVYFDEQEAGVSYFTLDLSANQTVTLYISGGKTAGFTLTISQG